MRWVVFAGWQSPGCITGYCVIEIAAALEQDGVQLRHPGISLRRWQLCKRSRPRQLIFAVASYPFRQVVTYTTSDGTLWLTVRLQWEPSLQGNRRP